MSFFKKNYSAVEVVYLFIRCNKTKFFLWNTNNTDRNGVNKQKTNTKHLQKDNIGKGGGRPTMSLDAFEFLFFDSAREASNDVNTFLNLRFIKKHKPAVFVVVVVVFEEILYANNLKVKKVSLNVPKPL